MAHVIYRAGNRPVEIDMSGFWLFNAKKEQLRYEKGVYGWYICEDNKKIYIYIGKSQAAFSSIASRFLGELCGPQVTTNKGKSADTDFRVSLTIALLTSMGYDVYFEHLSFKPEDEGDFIRKYKPILQNSKSKACNEFREVLDEYLRCREDYAEIYSIDQVFDLFRFTLKSTIEKLLKEDGDREDCDE